MCACRLIITFQKQRLKGVFGFAFDPYYCMWLAVPRIGFTVQIVIVNYSFKRYVSRVTSLTC